MNENPDYSSRTGPTQLPPSTPTEFQQQRLVDLTASILSASPKKPAKKIHKIAPEDHWDDLRTK